MAEKSEKPKKGERKSLVPLGSIERGKILVVPEKGIETPKDPDTVRDPDTIKGEDIKSTITENMTKIVDFLSAFTIRVLETPCCVDLEDKPLIVCSQALEKIKEERGKEKKNKS
jgi:hypothetical protein